MQLGDQRVFVTRNGRIGLGPHQRQRDDMVVLFFGADMPFVLRSTGALYRLMRPADVHGVMNGEGLNFGPKQNLMFFPVC